MWKYDSGTLRISVQYQSRCRRPGVSCAIPGRPNLNVFSLVASPMGKLILFFGHPQPLGYTMPITVTSPGDHLKPNVTPTEGWHNKEVVVIEEGEGSAPDVIYKCSEISALLP